MSEPGSCEQSRQPSPTEQVLKEWDWAMKQARSVAAQVPEFNRGNTREELLTLAHAIFIRNAIKDK